MSNSKVCLGAIPLLLLSFLSQPGDAGGFINAINYGDKLDIDNNPFSPDKEAWLIKKGSATILLYNIRKENLLRFLQDAASFTFL